jgi:acyl carrier protein
MGVTKDENGLETRLLRYLREITPPGAADITLGSEIFSTGLFDSLALVSLIQWVEEQIGRPLDPRTFDIRAEWDRVSDIVVFIERQR